MSYGQPLAASAPFTLLFQAAVVVAVGLWVAPTPGGDLRVAPTVRQATRVTGR